MAGASSPDSPWNCDASIRGLSNDRVAPRYTGTSLPNHSRTRRALRLVCSIPTLPYVVTTPRISSSGLATAIASTIASSVPGRSR